MYSIGQVLFVIVAKKSQVYPMQVIEVITKKTLKGEEVKYALRAGSDPNTVLMLDQIEGEVFESSEKVRQVLVQRATRQINKMVEIASTKSKEWYGHAPSTEDEIDAGSTLGEPPLDVDEHQEDMMVTLPDGTVAKVRMPSVS